MITIQDEVNEKVISLCIKGGRISEQILKNALREFLRAMEKQRSKKSNGRQEPEKKVAYQGKVSLEKLKEQDKELSNIEITDNNIKSFEKCARKYEVDYCLKKDKSREPPRYYVFFRARDADSITAAFKEYTGWQLKKSKKVSIRKKLPLAKERAAKHRERTKTKDKARDAAR